jgi:hypothetical protein
MAWQLGQTGDKSSAGFTGYPSPVSDTRMKGIKFFFFSDFIQLGVQDFLHHI